MKASGILAVFMAVMAGNACAADIGSLQDTAALAVSVAQSQDYEASQNMLSKVWDSGVKIKDEAPPVVMSEPVTASVSEVKAVGNLMVNKPVARRALGAKVPELDTKSIGGSGRSGAGTLALGLFDVGIVAALAAGSIGWLPAVVLIGAAVAILAAGKLISSIGAAIGGVFCGIIGAAAPHNS